uniref:Uncharacterized protein n=1 Tax=Hucho hucho TaxID=62062 RepID=A0A4W5K547_9TELE
VSYELWKLSLDDFPEDGERLIKDSREGLSIEEDRNYETLFGSHRLFVKEGVASCRASVRQLCEEAHRQCVLIQGVSKKDLEQDVLRRGPPGFMPACQSSGLSARGQYRQATRGQQSHPPLATLGWSARPNERSAYFLGVDRVGGSLCNSCPLTPVLSKAGTGVMEVMGVYGYDSLIHMLVLSQCILQLIGTMGAKAENSHVPVMKCSNFQMTKPTGEPGSANQNIFFPTKGLHYRQKYSSATPHPLR